MPSDSGPTAVRGRPAELLAAASPGERERVAHRLLDLTREMLALGRASDWVRFARRAEERQHLSSELFATPVPRESAAMVADCIRQVLELDQELITLAEGRRDAAARTMGNVRRGRQAADAYRRFSR